MIQNFHGGVAATKILKGQAVKVVGPNQVAKCDSEDDDVFGFAVSDYEIGNVVEIYTTAVGFVKVTGSFTEGDTLKLDEDGNVSATGTGKNVGVAYKKLGDTALVNLGLLGSEISGGGDEERLVPLEVILNTEGPTSIAEAFGKSWFLQGSESIQLPAYEDWPEWAEEAELGTQFTQFYFGTVPQTLLSAPDFRMLMLPQALDNPLVPAQMGVGGTIVWTKVPDIFNEEPTRSAWIGYSQVTPQTYAEPTRRGVESVSEPVVAGEVVFNLADPTVVYLSEELSLGITGTSEGPVDVEIVMPSDVIIRNEAVTSGVANVARISVYADTGTEIDEIRIRLIPTDPPFIVNLKDYLNGADIYAVNLEVRQYASGDFLPFAGGKISTASYGTVKVISVARRHGV